MVQAVASVAEVAVQAGVLVAARVVAAVLPVVVGVEVQAAQVVVVDVAMVSLEMFQPKPTTTKRTWKSHVLHV